LRGGIALNICVSKEKGTFRYIHLSEDKKKFSSTTVKSTQTPPSPSLSPEGPRARPRFAEAVVEAAGKKVILSQKMDGKDKPRG
jgi:hypothetical protein